MCTKHNCTAHRLEGPADLVLRRDRTYLVHASWCTLEGDMVTCTTPHGTRSWHSRELVEVRWRESQVKS